ncbi:hypothetical protein QQ020_04225 [Fulvivirgaceae bacterium BMA12]|uniref:Uncharacterized protein n=1 Tax=Agaribacillus aureus TaxID=3051825 RepID=A0ABT8L0K7_9BACT|nr:hypothetical protein [Fulvivirgaceae bacterium BMA12]
MTAFLIITAIVVGVIALMNLVKAKPREKPKSIMDTLNENPSYQEMKGLFDAMQKLNEEGTEHDIMPDGYGEFGLDITNPIPVNTVMGSIAYLGRIRTMDGIKVQYERVGSSSAPNIDQIIDEYEIFVKGQKVANLFICPYNKKNSERPPMGFKISPLP